MTIGETKTSEPWTFFHPFFIPTLHIIMYTVYDMYEVSRYIMYDIDYWGILVYSFMNDDDEYIYILYMYFHVFLHSHLPKNVFGFFCLRWNRRRMGIEWMFQVLGKSSTKMWSLWMVSCFCLLIATGWWLHCAPIVRGWNYQDQRKDRAVEGPKDSSVRINDRTTYHLTSWRGCPRTSKMFTNDIPEKKHLRDH